MLQPVWVSCICKGLLIVLSTQLTLPSLKKAFLDKGRKAKPNAFLHKAERTSVLEICVGSEQCR